MVLKLGCTSKDICQASTLLQEGRLVAVPTETVYGLAGSVTQLGAIQRIFRVKNRPQCNPLIIHIHCLEQVETLTCQATPQFYRLAKAFWPGPLTIITARHPQVPNMITGSQDTVAIRWSAHPLLQKILENKNLAVVAPSANPSGKLSPTIAQHVFSTLGSHIDAVVDGGSCTHGIESTIIYLNDAVPTLLRRGPIAPSDIEEVLGATLATPTCSAIISPGKLAGHYRPCKPLYLYSAFPDALPLNAAKIYLKRPANPESNAHWLSQTGRSEDIAHNLYALLHALDHHRAYASLHIQQMHTDDAIGQAINERLKRASTALRS